MLVCLRNSAVTYRSRAEISACEESASGIRVKNMIVIKTRLNSYRVPFREDEANPAVKRIFVEDPWGNRLEFVE